MALLLGVLPPARANDEQLSKAQDAYKQTLEKAEQALTAAFERNTDLVRQSSKKAEEKQKLIELLKAEKSAFEQNGWYPWSALS